MLTFMYLLKLFDSPFPHPWDANTCVLSLQSDYHFEYTECDALGSRWRVAVPNKADICTDLPDPVKGTQCSFSCSEGEFLNMQLQECQKCAVGTYSLGTGVAFDEWDTLPPGFVNHAVTTSAGDAPADCSNSTWTPKGDYVTSNTDECTATLSYAVSLKKPGTVSFEYFYPDDSIYFEFFIQNDQCQSTDSKSRWMKTSETGILCSFAVEFGLKPSGNNVLYWRTTAYTLEGSAVKPVLIKNIAISGVAFTSECFHCKPGTYSAKQGSARCAPCPAETYSNKGASVCRQCEQDTYAEAGSGSCKPRPACTNRDYFYTHTPCDSEGTTQLMYKWIEPKVCSETVEEAVKLPASGEKQTCPPCNPGFFVTNSSACEPCDKGFYSNGKACSKCPVGTEPVVGFEYKWWNTMPSNMKSDISRRDFGNSGQTWEVAGEYVYTTPGDQDTDYLMLTLDVPGYRLPQSMVKDSERSELSRITFVFETTCTADCKFAFLAVRGNVPTNDEVEQWKGSNSKQSYSYLIQSNSTISFTWIFQRTEELNTVRHITPCLSDCALDVQTRGGALLHYNFSPLSNVTGFHSSPRFTSKGLRYFHRFNLGLCGTEGRVPATCVENVTASGREVKGYVCQSTVVPSDIRSQSTVSTQPFVIGDTIIGVTTDTLLNSISSPNWLFPPAPVLPDVIFYYKSSETTQACKQGRSGAIRLRCDPSVTEKDQITLPSNCSEGTCDGCTFHFLWRSQHACPLCTKNNYREIVSACIQGIQKTTYVWQQPLQCYGGESLPAQTVSACVTLDFWLKFGVSTGTIAAVLLICISCYFWKKTRKLQYKYSKLIISSGNNECELPTADSCAIMEGEDTLMMLISKDEQMLLTACKESVKLGMNSSSRQSHRQRLLNIFTYCESFKMIVLKACLLFSVI
uniref:Endosome-lysosome associated apoptosis and autophagy regulator 1 n=1 Tax=Gasterosteus aculeatus aculeatus TaxID=481459 RepID=A0AAQ4P2U6_GASAC